MKAFFEDIAQGARPTIDDCVEVLGDELDLLRRFRDTPQDPEWHAEGDVHIHTGMVLKEAYALLGGPAAHLNEERRLLVVLGALLHDIAKPLCTRKQEINGVVRTVARGHEPRGRSYLAPRLLKAGLPYPILESLLGVVGHHHQPKLLVVKDRSEGAYKRVARLADPEILYWVEQADMRGRTCQDQAKAIEHIDMYRLFAKEYGAFKRGGTHVAKWSERLAEATTDCDDATRDLVHAHAQTSLENEEIKSVEEAIARSFGQRGAFSDLVVMVGLSGSGKSTFIERHLRTHEIISLDALRTDRTGRRADQSQNDRIVHDARERLKSALRRKANVVWDATNLRKDFRNRIAQLGRDYGALVTFVVMHLDPSVVRKRNEGRAHRVERSVLTYQLDQLEWPDLDEAHRILCVDEDAQVLGAFGCTGALPYRLEWSA